MKPLFRLARLIKLPIVFLSTLSAATGYIITGAAMDSRLPLFLTALMFLAAGSAALNQVQDREFDSKMERTRRRPLPAGEISLSSALILSCLLLAMGVVLLYLFFNSLTLLLGGTTVLLYNGVYTYLKRISPYAVIPGALIGALPPAMGWTAAGGSLFSAPLAGLMFFFYLWQIPHFWLLLGIRSHEYSGAGYPVITQFFSLTGFSRIIFTWIAAVLCTGLFLPLFGIFTHILSMALIFGSTLVVLGGSVLLIRAKDEGLTGVYRNSFHLINGFALTVIIVIIFEKGVFK